MRDCVRTKHFDEIWDNVSGSASDVELFQLISLLHLNPVGAPLVTEYSIPLGSYGSKTIDLDDWGVGSIIIMLRFLVLGGAFIAAYYIIFD